MESSGYSPPDEGHCDDHEHEHHHEGHSHNMRGVFLHVMAVSICQPLLRHVLTDIPRTRLVLSESLSRPSSSSFMDGQYSILLRRCSLQS